MSGNPNMLPKETSAGYCRRMGWAPGTRIVGDEGYGPTTITITAVGQERILAKADGRDESRWTLEHRDWQLAESAPTDHAGAIAEAAREYVAAVHAKERATSAYEDAIDARNTSGRAIHPSHAREDQLQQAVYAASDALTAAKGRAAQTRLALIDLVDAERAERGQS